MRRRVWRDTFDACSTALPARRCGTSDGTPRRARTALGRRRASSRARIHERAGDLLDVPYHGMPARAAALRAVLAGGRDLGATACVVLDAGVRTIAPGWIAALVAPVLRDGFDYVSPVYLRHPCEGRADKGHRLSVVSRVVRHATASASRGRVRLLGATGGAPARDRSLGAEMARRSASTSGSPPPRLAGGFTHVRSVGWRAHRRAATALGLEATLVQVVGALFADVEKRADVWQRVAVRGGGVGVRRTASARVGRAAAGRRTLYRHRSGWAIGNCATSGAGWSRRKPSSSCGSWPKPPPDRLRFDDELWARIVYDFALGYRVPRAAARSPARLADAAVSRLARLVHPSDDAMRRRSGRCTSRAVCHAFEASKRHLISRWRWPERLR